MRENRGEKAPQQKIRQEHKERDAERSPDERRSAPPTDAGEVRFGKTLNHGVADHSKKRHEEWEHPGRVVEQSSRRKKKAPEADSEDHGSSDDRERVGGSTDHQDQETRPEDLPEQDDRSGKKQERHERGALETQRRVRSRGRVARRSDGCRQLRRWLPKRLEDKHADPRLNRRARQECTPLAELGNENESGRRPSKSGADRASTVDLSNALLKIPRVTQRGDQ